MSWKHSVNFEAYCPRCGSFLNCFETSEGPNDIRDEDVCEYWETDVFYDQCIRCDRIISYELSPQWNSSFDGKNKIPISFYTISMSIKYEEHTPGEKHDE